MDRGNTRENPLRTSSQYVKGVGPARQKLLSRLGISTVEDLVMHVPRGYFDRSDLVPIAAAAPGKTATVRGEVIAVHPRRLGPRRSMLTAAIDDGTGALRLVFFNQPYLERAFRTGTRVIASGEVRLYRGEKQITAPEWERTGEGGEDDLIHAGRIVPVYPLTAGISQRMMRRIVREALDRCEGAIEENLPRHLLDELGLPGREEAIRQVHYPDDMVRHHEAMRRMKFEEVFFLHLLIHERRMKIRSGAPRPAVAPPHILTERYIEGLPFTLTAAQRRVLGEITADVESPEGLARLLQGDVGSGKTVVAVASMLLAVGAGYQAALMVPTEILAHQHAQRIGPALEAIGVRSALLIGSMSAAEKERIHALIADGAVDVVVGTHTLIQEGIRFRQLGLAVIDEQHRFGVRQRAELGRGDVLPHFLVMTATPIPRSLAQTVYGDLELSMIDELPAPRRVRTELVPESRIDEVYREVRRRLGGGAQAFILYPLVEESERIDLKSATAEFERLGREVFPDMPIGLLHGRMTFEEKARAVDLFREGAIRALVTTTVIEVGVDIPGASILLINHPERFGLAQLHQLRGRVGRGGNEGICYLLIGDEAGAQGEERLRMFAGTDDGFRVAEIDLRLRGPGEIWGTRQSGYPTFRLVNPLADRELVERSWEESARLLENDPLLGSPANEVVRRYYREYYAPRMAVADIG
jgi:ATP-dependent DNA helicase RecG